MNMRDRTFCQQLLYFDSKRYIRRSFSKPSSTSAPEFCVYLHLSCKSRTEHWVVHEDSSDPELLKRSQGPMKRKLIRLNLKQFISKKRAHKIIGKKIKKWPVWRGGRQLLIDFVLRKAWEDMESLPPTHNVVHFYFHVIPEHKYVLDKGYEIRSATNESMEEEEDDMVPALESSIDSLKNVTLMESGNCAICLEEFVNGDEGHVSMPCWHIFHGDCIKKWLNTSHYCPICRFQMPTS